MSFSVDISVRSNELDALGHLNQAVYLQYAEHARWEVLLAVGLSLDRLARDGIGPVLLAQTVTYARELRGGDRAQVTWVLEYGSGQTFKAVQRIIKEDGATAADIVGTGGIFDLSARRLVADPAARLRVIADRPEVLGLGGPRRRVGARGRGPACRADSRRAPVRREMRSLPVIAEVISRLAPGDGGC